MCMIMIITAARQRDNPMSEAEQKVFDTPEVSNGFMEQWMAMTVRVGVGRVVHVGVADCVVWSAPT